MIDYEVHKQQWEFTAWLQVVFFLFMIHVVLIKSKPLIIILFSQPFLKLKHSTVVDFIPLISSLKPEVLTNIDSHKCSASTKPKSGIISD